MAQFVVNPLSSPDGSSPTSRGIVSLADAISGAGLKRMELEAQAARDRAAMMNDYAGQYANEALAAQRHAAMALDQQKLDGLARIDAIWADPNLDPGAKFRASAPIAMSLGLDPGKMVSALPAFGMGMEEMDPYIFAQHGNFGNTVAGNREQQAADQFAADSELVEVIVNGQQVWVPRRDADGLPTPITRDQALGMAFGNLPEEQQLDAAAGTQGDLVSIVGDAGQVELVNRRNAAGMQPVLSETDAKGLAFGALTRGQQAQSVYGTPGDLVSVIGDDGSAVLVNTMDAAGMRPVLPETDAKGLAMQTGNVPPDTEGLFEGAGMDAQALSLLDALAAQVEGGTPLTPQQQRQRDVAVSWLGQSKPELRTLPDGTLVSVNVPGYQLPPGLTALLYPEATAAAPAAPPAAPPPATGRFDVQPGQLPAAPAPSVQGPLPPPGAAPGVSTLIPGDPRAEPLSATLMRQKDLGGAFSSNVQRLNELTGWDPRSKTFSGSGYLPGTGYGLRTLAADAVSGMLGDTAGSLARNALQGGDEELFSTIGWQAIEPLLRLRTGAAAPDQEVVNYRQYLPEPFLDEATQALRMNNLNEMADAAMKLAAEAGMSVDEFSMLAVGDSEQARQIRADFASITGLPPEDAAVPPAAAPAPDGASGVSSTGIPFRIRSH